MFIELHMLQNFAPSNLNRDDTNNPKDCEFGGVRRARISSQCIKRAIRFHKAFSETTKVSLSFRSKLMAAEIQRVLQANGIDKSEAEKASLVFSAELLGGIDIGKDDERNEKEARSKVLFFFHQDEIQKMADLLKENWEDVWKIVQKLEITKHIAKKFSKPSDRKLNKWMKNFLPSRGSKKRTSAPDIAMFGRMLANEPRLNLNAACQVAHAISTHRVSMEMDFFTAVDDLQQEEETGAGMMGITPFNSACFYRYSRIDWGQLLENLDGDTGLTRKTVEGFLLAAVQAVPTGKQNSFAAQNPPSFLLAVVRQDGKSWSLANAFERPVRPDRSGGVVKPSIEALDAYWGQLNRVYGDAAVPVQTVALAVDGAAEFPNLQDAQVESVTAWVDAVLNNLPQE